MPPGASGRARGRAMSRSERYGDRIAAFEVVNEPNGQLWPQRTTIETDDFDARWGTRATRRSAAPAASPR